MKTVGFVLVLFCLFGCGTNNQIVGTYRSKENPDYFEFKPDGTFVYKYAAIHTALFSTGIWKRESKNHIILNSMIKGNILPLRVIEKNATGEGSIMITLDSSDSLESRDYKCELFIDDTLYILNSLHQLRSTGVSEESSIHEINSNNIYFRYIRSDSLFSVFLDFPIRSIFFKILKQPLEHVSTAYYRDPLITEHYYLKSTTANALEINVAINDSLFQYKIFNSVNVILKKAGIYYFDESGKRKYWVPRVN